MVLVSGTAGLDRLVKITGLPEQCGPASLPRGVPAPVKSRGGS